MDSSRRRGGTHNYPRVARVNALLQQILAEQIERLADRDERLAMVTVTEVVATTDVKQAVVYCSSLPDAARAALEEHRRTLQKGIGAEARFKSTPVLTFAADPAVLAGERIEAAIRRVRERTPELPE
jgi:ribosome-binding factor A